MKNTITDLINYCVIPHTSNKISEFNAIKTINIEQNDIHVHLEFIFPVKHFAAELQKTLETQIKNKFSDYHVHSQIEFKSEFKTVQMGLSVIPGIKNIVAVASGKGGVGKSTLTTHLAVALSLQGARVGILDADIYGPNQPQMLGIHTQPKPNAEKLLLPLIAHDIQTMSMGYLVENTETPMIWRGPMIASAMQQMLNETAWDKLDYLFLDLPPGTGDIQLTMSQKIPVSGSVVITTPQDIALLDVKKAINMFAKVKVPVLGIIENMSEYVCKHCGHTENIFGEHGADQLSEQFDIPLLGKIPLDIQIRKASDQGIPVLIQDENNILSQRYHKIALALAMNLAKQPKNLSAKFPKIVIEK